jgi:hypothetical protein
MPTPKEIKAISPNNSKFIELINEPMDFYIQKIKSGEKISFSRWGDIEFYLAMKKFAPKHHMMPVYNSKETNKSGHHLHFPQATTKLLSVLLNQKDYMWSMGKLSNKNWGDAIYKLFSTYQIQHDWYDVDVFLRANCNGELWPLVELLRSMKVLYIGPKHVIGTALERVLGKGNYLSIEVPTADCLLAEEDVFKKIQKFQKDEKPDLIGYSCSMLANILIDRLHDYSECSMIDFGSIWDIYAGVRSRSFFVKMDNWDQLMKLNLKEN